MLSLYIRKRARAKIAANQFTQHDLGQKLCDHWRTRCQKAGLSVWFDELAPNQAIAPPSHPYFSISLRGRQYGSDPSLDIGPAGDRLRRKIDTGLARSRLGVVVLSQSFLGKGWPNYALDGLVTEP